MALQEFAIDQEVIEKAEGQRAPSKPVSAGVYEATIKNAYIRKTDSGAQMVEVELDLGEVPMFYSTCVMSKKGTTTYTKDGKQFALPGVNEMLALFQLLTGEKKIVGEPEKTKHRDEIIDALVLKPIIGKKVLVGVRLEESLYNGEVRTKPIITQWMDLEGKNEKGELVGPDVAAFLERNPVKKLKAEAVPTQSAGVNTADMAKSGW